MYDHSESGGGGAADENEPGMGGGRAPLAETQQVGGGKVASFCTSFKQQCQRLECLLTVSSLPCICLFPHKPPQPPEKTLSCLLCLCRRCLRRPALRP